jgi:tRNA pseudouridine13 synthase
VKGEGAPVVRALARDPADFLGAFRAIEPRLRKLIVSRYQSWLWNEEVARALRAEIPRERRFEIMYRGGTLVFWRALEEAERAAYERRLVPFPQFPLPAALGVRAAAGARPLLVRPRAIAAGPDEPDEAFPDRRKVRLTMELPRGAYATLVAKRLFYEP